ncbi:T9SS C-terminal target domain-containing protein [Pseudoxanthomonas sp. SGD-10]|nr:T9SS C-terminal target domain-containing protein [Pseudoxanthomonas sp. SGD-10]
MKKILLSLIGLCFIANVCFAQVLATWDFENLSSTYSSSGNNPPPADFVVADGLVASKSEFSAYHTNSSDWSSPAGSPGRSISSNNWSIGDYFQFTTSTAGYADISFSFRVYSSNTGPRDFKVQYNVDNSGWNDVPSSIANYVYQSGAASWSTKTLDLSSIAELNSKTSVSFRLVCNGPISARAGTGSYPADETFAAPAGTSRIDNVTISASKTLPVTTTDFTAKPINNAVLLNWQTLSEQNNKHFEIERSVDGEIFTSLTTLPGAGNSNERIEYSYTDYAPLAGVNFYRLLQQDFDGTTTIIKTIAVNPHLNVNQLSAFVTNTGVNVTLYAEKAGLVNVELYDFNGRKLAEQSASIEAGINNTTVTADLLPGLYFIKVVSENEVSTVKFAK